MKKPTKEERKAEMKAWQEFREHCSPEQAAEAEELISEGATRGQVLAHFGWRDAVAEPITLLEKAVQNYNRRFLKAWRP